MWEVLDEPETFWKGTQVRLSVRKSNSQHPHDRLQQPSSGRTVWPLLSPTSGETLMYLDLGIAAGWDLSGWSKAVLALLG